MSRLESDATRTVSPDGGNSARGAPPASNTATRSAAHAVATRGARRAVTPSSHKAFTAAAIQPIRKVTPQRPVTERTWSKARFPDWEYATEPQLPNGPNERK